MLVRYNVRRGSCVRGASRKPAAWIKHGFRTRLPILIFSAVIASGFFSPGARQAHGESLEVYFSPGDACLNAIVQEILKAKSSVCVLSSELNSREIAGALGAVSKNHVNVTVLLDQDRLGGGGLTRTYLKTNHVSVLVDKVRSVESNVVLIDDKVVLAGSCPMTVQSAQHTGNLLIIRNNQTVFNSYFSHWTDHLRQGGRITEQNKPRRVERVAFHDRVRPMVFRSASLPR